MEEKHIAKNGAVVYSYKNPALHSFFISLFLRAGSVYESADESGITHFLEHVAIRNVNAIMNGELYRTLDRCGLEFNAYTCQDFVQFYVSGASEHFGVGAEILSRLFSPIVLSKHDVDAERKRIKAEIRESDEKNSLTGFTSRIVYKGSPLANPILGANKTVDRITRRRLEEHRKSSFSKENLFFYVTGSFSGADLASLCERVGQLDIPSAPPREGIIPQPTDFMKRGGGVYVKNADFTMMKFTFDIDEELAQRPECDVIYDMLLCGYNSRFFIEMSENRGLFYDINGSLDRFRGLATFSFSYEVKEKEIYRAAELTVDILKRFLGERLSESDVIRAPYTTNAYMLFDDAREFNFTYAYDNHILDRGYNTVEDRVRAYEAVTAESIIEVAKQIFRLDNLTLTIKGKRSRIDAQRLENILSSL